METTKTLTEKQAIRMQQLAEKKAKAKAEAEVRRIAKAEAKAKAAAAKAEAKAKQKAKAEVEAERLAEMAGPAKEVIAIAKFKRLAKTAPEETAQKFTTKAGHHVTRTTRENLSNGSSMQSIGITTRESFSVIDSIRAEKSGTWTIQGAHIRCFTVKSSGLYVIRINGKSVSKADALAFLKAN